MKKRLNRVGFIKSLTNYRLSNLISFPQIQRADIAVPIVVGVNVTEISPPQQDRLGLSPCLQLHSWVFAHFSMALYSSSVKQKFFCVNIHIPPRKNIC